jgi:hypothetical protein
LSDINSSYRTIRRRGIVFLIQSIKDEINSSTKMNFSLLSNDVGDENRVKKRRRRRRRRRRRKRSMRKEEF